MRSETDAVLTPAFRKFKLPDASPEDFGQRGISGRVLHLVAPITKGESRLTVNGRLVHEGTLLPGMLRVCNPSDKERREFSKPAEIMVFTLPFTRFERLCANHGGSGPCADQVSECQLIRHPLVQRLTSLAMLAEDLSPEAKAVVLEGIADALVGVLLDFHRKRFNAELDRQRKGLSGKQLRDSMEFADEHLGQKLSVSEWAGVTRLSPSEFSRRFLVSTHFTPYAWYINRRIERAQELLQKPRTDISELAFELGFTSQSHFTEAFRRRTGMSPARWRSLH